MKIPKKEKQTYEIFSKYRAIIMGIATLSILIFHLTEECSTYNYNFNGLIYYFNRWIGSSGVDIFLFLSGLGLYYSWKKNKDYKSFLNKRLKKVLIPYLIISIAAYTIKNVFIANKGILSILKGVTFYDFLTKGDRLFWYILMILICYVIYPWIYEITEENHSKIKSQTTMIGVFTFVSTLALMLQKYNPSIFSAINIMLLRFPIFVFGSFVGKASYEKRALGKEWLAFIILTLICLPLREKTNIVLIRYICGMISLTICFLIIQIFEQLRNYNFQLKFLRRILEWFGKYSLEIYLCHVAVRNIMRNMGYLTCRIRYFLLMVIISIILAISIKKLTDLINKLISKQKSTL